MDASSELNENLKPEKRGNFEVYRKLTAEQINKLNKFNGIDVAKRYKIHKYITTFFLILGIFALFFLFIVTFIMIVSKETEKAILYFILFLLTFGLCVVEWYIRKRADENASISYLQRDAIIDSYVKSIFKEDYGINEKVIYLSIFFVKENILTRGSVNISYDDKYVYFLMENEMLRLYISDFIRGEIVHKKITYMDRVPYLVVEQNNKYNIRTLNDWTIKWFVSESYGVIYFKTDGRPWSLVMPPYSYDDAMKILNR